jgi:hypothetical protein
MLKKERYKVKFWIGIAMIAYDFFGHFLCLISRLTGSNGAYLWNTYSRYIYPIRGNQIEYDVFWSTWFFVAMTLIIWGRKIP